MHLTNEKKRLELKSNLFKGIQDVTVPNKDERKSWLVRTAS